VIDPKGPIDPKAKEIITKRRIFARVQKLCDEKGLPYPPELCAWLMDTMRFRIGE